MSTHATSSQRRAPGREPGVAGGVPKSVAGAAVLAAAGGLAAIADAVLALTHGKAMLHSMADNLLGGQLDGLSKADVQPLIDDAVDSAYQTLQGRAYIWIVLALVSFALAVPIRRLSGKVRVTATVFLLGQVGLAFVDLRDQTPSALHALDGVALALALATLVALWLPASGEYVRNRR